MNDQTRIEDLTCRLDKVYDLYHVQKLDKQYYITKRTIVSETPKVYQCLHVTHQGIVMVYPYNKRAGWFRHIEGAERYIEQRQKEITDVLWQCKGEEVDDDK